MGDMFVATRVLTSEGFLARWYSHRVGLRRMASRRRAKAAAGEKNQNSKGAFRARKQKRSGPSSPPGPCRRRAASPSGASAPRMPRECPPRPNVPSTYTPRGSVRTSASGVSRSIADVCVPSPAPSRARRRFPFWRRSRDGRPPARPSRRALGARRLGRERHRTRPLTPPALVADQAHVARAGRVLREERAHLRLGGLVRQVPANTSYPSPRPCVGPAPPRRAWRGGLGFEPPPRLGSARGAWHLKHALRLAKFTEPHAHVQSLAPESCRDALPGGGTPNGSATAF